MVRSGVLDSPIFYALVASVGPVASHVAEAPAVLFEGTAASMLMAVGVAIWRLTVLGTKFLENAEKHRELEVKEWAAEAAHRVAEQQWWTS